MTRKILAASLIITGLIALGLVGNQDYADAQAQARRYCADVALWTSQASTPKVHRDGHPDYRNIAAEACPGKRTAQ